jgi:hypothetical protein
VITTPPPPAPAPPPLDALALELVDVDEPPKPLLLLLLAPDAWQAPFAQVSLFGQTAPVQSLTHWPIEQNVPAGHGLAHDGSTHAPDVASHLVVGATHVMPSHCAHEGKHCPSRQISPVGHDVLLQGSMQASSMHVCPWGHTTPMQGARQAPPWQTWPDAHVTPRQPFAMQRPDFVSHVVPGKHGNSPLSQCGTHAPW